MLNSITIKNFQSHKQSHLDFSPGVNVIVGSSDSGKTAIIRALRWLVWNRPTGDSIRSWWGGDTEVTLTLPTGVVSRIKGKENQYFLNSLEFKAFGTDVPEEVTKELNLTEINLQQQLEKPFLLSDSPGEVAQHFNRIAQLDVIDKALSNVQKWTRNVEQNLKARQQQLKETEEKLQQYDYLDDMEQEVNIVEDLEKEIVLKQQQISKLKQIFQELREIQEAEQTFSNILSIEKEVLLVLDLLKRKERIQKTITELTQLKNSIVHNTKQIEEIKEHLQNAGLIDSALSILQEKEQIIKKKESLVTLIKEINSNENKIQDISKHLEALLSQMPETCPFCGQTMPKEKI